MFKEGHRFKDCKGCAEGKRIEGYVLKKKAKKPLYLNIGSGRWKHPFWHTLDFPFEGYSKSDKNCDIAFDLMSMKQLPIQSASLEAIFTSHTIEHLNDPAVAYLFEDAYRLLEERWFFRITCPDAALAYSAFKRNDKLFWAPHHEKYSIEQLLLSSINTSSSQMMASEADAIEDNWVRTVVSSNAMEDALTLLSPEKCADSINRHPQSHDAWFTEDKLIEMLKTAGFKSARASRFGQSQCVAMRDTGYDTTRPDISLYVEAQK